MCHHWIEALVNCEVTMISKRGYLAGFLFQLKHQLQGLDMMAASPQQVLSCYLHVVKTGNWMNGGYLQAKDRKVDGRCLAPWELNTFSPKTLGLQEVRRLANPCCGLHSSQRGCGCYLIFYDPDRLDYALVDRI